MAVRVQRWIAEAGLCSRRRAEEWIEAGRVQINGQRAQLGDRVEPGRDRVFLDGNEVRPRDEKRYIILHKPIGYTTSLKDRHADHLIRDLVPERFGRLFPVGRLDRETSGIILLTNDGDLAYRLTHPSFQVPKVYEAWIEGVPRANHLDRLKRGIQLDEGVAKAQDIEIVKKEEGRAMVRLTLTEGKKREVRRIFQAVGHPVKSLTRVEFAGIKLDGLEPGAYRPLTNREVKFLIRQTANRSQTQPLSTRKRSERTPYGKQKDTPGRSRGQYRIGAEVSSGKSRDSVRNPRGDSGRTNG